MTSKFVTYWRQMNREDREAYAKRAGTTYGYIDTQLIYRHKHASGDMMRRLAEASNGELTPAEVFEHFLDRVA